MKPQTRAYLEEANELLRQAAFLLEQAQTLVGMGLTEAAGRAVYLAGFHAAQGFLFEATNKIHKTYNGVQSEFGRLTRGDPRFDVETRAFLSSAYDLKATADYETGPDAHITQEQAAAALMTARDFVATIEKLIGA